MTENEQHTLKDSSQHRFTFQVPAELYETIQTVADERDQTTSDLVRGFVSMNQQIDSVQLEAFRTERNASLYVGTEVIDPHLLAYQYSPSPEQKIIVTFNKQVFENVRRTSKQLNQPITAYIVHSMQLGLAILEKTKEIEYFGKPYLLPITVGDQHFAFIF